ncbi:MAG: phosphate ABC transporter permease PstA [Actinomycetota bacterium]|nr:phosphate ABC transporter permease PstA [Actinomycetota bacterium]MEC7590719.1 phosphate ABC transporter permease PstA [Actinomycetota bacterium]MEC8444964.1 phosphate ABC transporter permease PstA [Actinomycetota bacterium]MEC8648035.1 phosphate ABC transporter permease PstA [Actinomycetota bacterium]MEC9180510.1 phosphate ABC transporter permease PstA [Actinomycetota bacterium]
MTQVLDREQIVEWAAQQPQRPWTKKPARLQAWIAVAALVPAVLVALILMYTEIPGPVLLVAVYFPLQLLAAGIAAVATKGRQGAADSVIIVLSVGATLFSFIILASVLGSLIVRGLEALWGEDGFRSSFLFQNNVYINPSTPLEYGGLGHAVIGTLMIVLIASLIAVPIGIATAVYITEVRGRAVPYVRFFVQAMSGIPSIVAGLFILTVLIVSGAMNQSAFAGGLAYAILMLPTVTRTAEEVLRLIPEDLRTGALALGSTRARVVLRVVIPAAKTGVITAIILGVARVIGETAPLLLTSLKSDQTILNPLADPIAALPTYIFDNVALPYPGAVTRAWGAALVLMILVLILFTLARILGRDRLNRFR